MFIVSIITPTYNSEKYIMATYQSIASQTMASWEWLVSDDCSSDSTKKIISDITKNDTRVKPIFSEKNVGAAVARNKSLNRATGDYIAFIDADDLWKPEKLKEQMKFMQNGINFSFTAYELIDKNGIPLNKYVDIKNNGKFDYEDLLRKKVTVGCSTVMLRKNAFNKIEMPNIRTGQDYALWLQLLKQGCVACLYNKPLTKYRIVPNSISRNKFKKALRQWDIYRKIEKLSLIKSTECFFWYAIRALVR